MQTPDFGPRYEYLRELGSGGVGRVVLVRDTHLGLELAMKLLEAPLASGDAIERFQREFALLTGIEHPGIARAHDFGYLGERPFFTSEFIPGETLAQRAPPSPEKLLSLATEVAEAIDFLHRSGILHLDLKPSNVMLSSRGRRPVLIDFGLFRRGISSPPGPGIQGSLPYMAPECFDGEPLGPWTDVYAFGVTLYRIATGKLPRRGGSRRGGALDGGGWDPAPRPPSSFGLLFPPDLDNIVLKCLALDPRSRFQDGGALLQALRAAAGPGTAARVAPAAVPRTVGRETELRAADAFLDGMASTREAAVLLVTGPRGAGQTHFLREVKVRAQLKGLRFYLETGYAGRRGPPGALLRPLAENLREPARSRWNDFLSRLRKPRQSTRNETSEEERRLRWTAEVALAAGAVRDPMILGVDGLERFDEVSVTLLLSLARSLAGNAGDERPPIGIVAGYREEGPSTRWLRDLTAQMLEPGNGRILALHPLGPAETLEIYRSMGGPETETTRGLQVFQETQGLPARIAALAAGARRGPEALPGGEPVTMLEDGKISTAESTTLEPDARRVTWTLMLAGRPTAAAELSSFTGIPRRRLAALLGRLAIAGFALEDDAGAGWLPGRRAGATAHPSAAERSRMHRRIASRLCRAAKKTGDPGLAEAVHHFRAAGSRGMVLRHGLPLARYLKLTFQSRAAADLYREIVSLLPRNRRARLKASLELADLEARVGDLDDGIRLLGEVLSAPRRTPEPWRTRVLLRLAALHSRRGDSRRADALFREGIEQARRGDARLTREETLHFLNEHAAMKVFAGDHAKAKELCAEGLSLAGDKHPPRLREAVLNLHATEGNIALRELRFDEAVHAFETALEIAEAAGSLASKAVVLNNLGIVHSQCDRFREAIAAFQEAERTCLRIDEGPSLTFIHGNLAVLHAKTGKLDAAEASLAEASRLGRVASGPRQELFLHHHAGLALLYGGRFADARRNLEKAIRRGEAIGDRLVTAFDEVYRAECLVFEGRYAEAGRELRRIAGGGGPARVRAMACARESLLAALTSQTRDRSAEEALAAREALLAKEQRVPFLDAWDALYLGWALAISGFNTRAFEVLAPAEAYFRRNGLLPAASLASWVQAEARLLSGNTKGAREKLSATDPGSNGLTAALRPLLLARLCLDDSGKPDATGSTLDRAADLLAEAGAALVANPLPEWALRLDALREALHKDEGATQARKTIERRRRDLVRDLPQDAQRAYMRSSHWKAWTKVARRRGGRAPSAAIIDDSTRTRTVSLRGEAASSLRAGLVALSPGMRAVANALESLRETDLPVVISGETGAGKEMIARIIHAESRRFAGPFLVLDLATIPAPLLEVELFGARAGAFTDLNADRDGILTRATGGTLLVDEVAGASLEAQARLLRVLSEGAIRPVGGETTLPVDVRFLFSTSRDLERETREGRFRADLLHRIQVLAVRVPPLRERSEDLPGLVDLILRESDGPAPALEAGVIDRLRELGWPGNVRELRNRISRLRIEQPREITLASLGALRGLDARDPVFQGHVLANESLPALKDQLERDYIEHHLRRLSGNAAAASRFLGVSRKHFYRRCRQLGIRLREKPAN